MTAALYYTGAEHTYRVSATRRHAAIRPRPGITRAVQVDAVTECRCPLAGTGGHGIPVGAVITVPVSSLTEATR